MHFLCHVSLACGMLEVSALRRDALVQFHAGWRVLIGSRHWGSWWKFGTRGRSEAERQLESHVPRVVGAAHIFLGPENTPVPLNRSLQAGSSNALHCMDTFPCSITFLLDPFVPHSGWILLRFLTSILSTSLPHQLWGAGSVLSLSPPFPSLASFFSFHCLPLELVPCVSLPSVTLAPWEDFQRPMFLPAFPYNWVTLLLVQPSLGTPLLLFSGFETLLTFHLGWCV